MCPLALTDRVTILVFLVKLSLYFSAASHVVRYSVLHGLIGLVASIFAEAFCVHFIDPVICSVLFLSLPSSV